MSGALVFKMSRGSCSGIIQGTKTPFKSLSTRERRYGRQRRSLLDVVDCVRGRFYGANDLVANGSLSLISLNNIATFGGGGGWNPGAEKPYSGSFKPEQLVRMGDVIMAVTDMTKERRLVGHVARIPCSAGKAVISVDLIKLVPKEVTANYLYSMLRFSGIAGMIAMLANGTNVLHLKPGALARVGMLIPSDPIQTIFPIGWIPCSI